MTSLFRSPEFKVGLLVILVSALVAVMALKVAEGPGVFSGQREFYFRAENAGGLVENSAVRMAGIKVGVIKDIVLEDGHAKIIISLNKGARLTQSSAVELKAQGILGDKIVELIPGKSDEPELTPGSELNMKAGRGGLDDVMSDVTKVSKSLNELLQTLNQATKVGDGTTPIGRIVSNIESITNDLKSVSADNKDKINEIIDRVQNLSKNVDTYINEESLSRVDRSLRNIEDITAKISKGEGTLGRLINDDQTVEQLNSAITNVNRFLGGAEKMETTIDFHSEFLSGPSQTKSYLGLKIQPGLDRYYEVAVIDDPEGTRRSTYSETSTNGGPTNTFEETTYYRNKLKITALFAKNFWDFTVKGGIIENSGGVGIDYHLLSKRLRFSAELFNFQSLQVRAFARYNFMKGIYMVAGGDNLLGADNEDPSAFIGAGLFITNDDLKMLASKVSF